MATGKTILKGALRVLNVKASVDSLSSEELNDGKESLNQLIESWSNEKLMQPALVEITHTLTASDGQYSIGSGGDIDTTRPLHIESAVLRKDNHDYRMDMMESREWSSLFRKTTVTPIPRKIYYRESYPLGEINLYPVPTEANILVMQVWTQITAISNMDTTLTLPPGYERALKYNLAMDIAPEDGKQATQDIARIASTSKKGIKNSNYGQVSRQRIEASNITRRSRSGDVNTGGFY